MTQQKEEVSGFFNDISDTYKEKYTGDDAFLNYFFNERLKEATRGFEFASKAVLDIGAGTGDLYDAIAELSPDYYGCDIAAGMLQSSNIPEDRRFVGPCYEVELPVEKFDLVYMLGVTTYLPPDELEKTLDFVAKVLKPDGRFVCTFTNAASADWLFRKLSKVILKRLGNRDKVLGQGFEIYPMSVVRAKEKTSNSFDHVETRYLNHTVFPFYHLSKPLSAGFAKKLHNRLQSGRFLDVLSSDFMFVLKHKAPAS